jgi:hypothetical protein
MVESPGKLGLRGALGCYWAASLRRAVWPVLAVQWWPVQPTQGPVAVQECAEPVFCIADFQAVHHPTLGSKATPVLQVWQLSLKVVHAAAESILSRSAAADACC